MQHSFLVKEPIMKATNYIKLEGNIGMDITTGATKNGKAWCRFRFNAGEITRAEH